MKILNDIACNLNWNALKRIQIQMKRNGVQINTKGFKNLLMIMVLKFIFLKRCISKDTFPFHSSLLVNQLNKFLFGWPMESKVLLKTAPMDHIIGVWKLTVFKSPGLVVKHICILSLKWQPNSKGKTWNLCYAASRNHLLITPNCKIAQEQSDSEYRVFSTGHHLEADQGPQSKHCQ
jgi:hypothetical protein